MYAALADIRDRIDKALKDHVQAGKIRIYCGNPGK